MAKWQSYLAKYIWNRRGLVWGTVIEGTWRLTCMAMVLLLAACTISSPVPPNRLAHPTVTTEADAWRSLQQRPLHFPTLASGTPCPTMHGKVVLPAYGPALGQGPVYAVFFGGVGSNNVQGILVYGDARVFADGGSNWGGTKVIWLIRPSYQGPVLIRGGLLDGSSSMRFNGGLDQQGPLGFSNQALLNKLRLTGNITYDKPWPSWGTYTRLQAPGCYAYQVDGFSFSYLIIFNINRRITFLV